MTRTTIVLDEESRQALDALAAHYRCSVSEAVRRAAIRQRDLLLGVPEERRRERTAALRTLIKLSRGQDPAAEVARIKREDAGG